MEIQDLINRIFHNSIIEHEIIEFREEIEDVGVKRFLVQLMTTTSPLTSSKIMRNIPGIFDNLYISDFLNILEALPNWIHRMEFIGFLSKYMKINGLSILLQSKLEIKEKLKIFSFYKDNIFLLFMTDIESITYNSKEVNLKVNHIYSTLLDDNFLPEMIEVEDLMSEYIKVKLFELNNQTS